MLYISYIKYMFETSFSNNNRKWAVVLLYLYDKGPILYDSDNELGESHNQVSDLDLTVEELTNTLSRMRNWNLVEYNTSTEDGVVKKKYTLTEKGFNVAHQREQNNSREEINRSLVLLTWILAASALIQAFSAVVTTPEYIRPWVAISAISILIIFGIGVFLTAKRD